MAGHFTVTYDIVTPESAEDGDAAERGFSHPGGWKTDDRGDQLTLREALQAAGDRNYSRRYGAEFEDGGRAWYTIDGNTNYRTGEETTYAVHPPAGITAASYRRVSRLLTGK